jgi:spore coat protein CotF
MQKGKMDLMNNRTVASNMKGMRKTAMKKYGNAKKKFATLKERIPVQTLAEKLKLKG